MIPALDRPPSALPNSYLWTWDHSTNWMLDDPGMQTSGCYNPYLKRPETFIEDYRRLTDLAAGLGIKGITIAGFLRDSHGGVDASKRVAAYGAECGVAIMPCFGTNWYQGPYYEGDHPYNLSAFLARHPEARILDADGNPRTFMGEYGATPAHPAFQDWLREALQWMFREFEIGGMNIENGDMLIDYHPLTQAKRAEWPAGDPEAFFFQGLCYRVALEAVADFLPHKLVTYATYTGFNYGDELEQNVSMGRTPPAMLRILPDAAVAQWTLTGMVRAQPLALLDWLDDGAPAAAIDHPTWPQRLPPPAPRNTGFLHHGSQWHGGRHQCVVSAIKEACLRAYRAGLEGVSIHGEVSARYVPWALNYLAFSHFTHWPEDSLRDFGKKTLAQVLASAEQGEEFAEIMARAEAGLATETDRKTTAAFAGVGYGFGVPDAATPGGAGWTDNPRDTHQRQRYWQWLQTKIDNGFAENAMNFF